jgi:hypothetical protein
MRTMTRWLVEVALWLLLYGIAIAIVGGVMGWL